MKSFKLIYLFILYFLFKKSVARFEEKLTNNSNESIIVPYWKFKIFYQLSSLLKDEKIWLVFLIDSRAKLVTSFNLDVNIEVKSNFWLKKKSFDFLPSHAQFIPNDEFKRNIFLEFLIKEVWDHKKMLSLFLVLFIILYYNTNIDILEKLSTTNITIITIFVSIYLVLFTLNMQRTKSKINEFFSGIYNVKYEFNKNTFLLAMLSLSISIISIVIINIKLQQNIIDILISFKILGRYSVAAILAVSSLFLTYICLFNIVHYYLELDREQVYNDSINKIINDQQKLLSKKYRDRFKDR